MARAALVLFGDRGLDRAFQRLERVDQRKGINKASREAFRPILVAAKANAPVGPTGKLKKFIRMRAFKNVKGARQRYIGVVVRTGTREEMGLDANAKGYYPQHVELGSEHNAANPYLRSAFDALKDRASAVFNSRLWQFIRGDWGR